MSATAVVLLSGGQDSTTCFYQALDLYGPEGIEAVSFDYGQRHRVELTLAEVTAARAGVPHTVYDVPALAQLGAASLTNEDIRNPGVGSNLGNAVADGRVVLDVPASRNVFADELGLPPSFVPGRNLLFFTLAAAHAAKVGAHIIVSGVCEQDRSGYPDCRSEFVEQMGESIRLGFDWDEFVIAAPLLHLSKAETWALADQLGILDRIVLDTHTCYEGDRSGPPKPWGYGCGECGACIERMRGYEEFRQTTSPAART